MTSSEFSEGQDPNRTRTELKLPGIGRGCVLHALLEDRAHGLQDYVTR
jgi:hypothetical protein